MGMIAIGYAVAIYLMSVLSGSGLIWKVPFFSSDYKHCYRFVHDYSRSTTTVKSVIYLLFVVTSIYLNKGNKKYRQLTQPG